MDGRSGPKSEGIVLVKSEFNLLVALTFVRIQLISFPVRFRVASLQPSNIFATSSTNDSVSSLAWINFARRPRRSILGRSTRGWVWKGEDLGRWSGREERRTREVTTTERSDSKRRIGSTSAGSGRQRVGAPREGRAVEVTGLYTNARITFFLFLS